MLRKFFYVVFVSLLFGSNLGFALGGIIRCFLGLEMSVASICLIPMNGLATLVMFPSWVEIIWPKKTEES